MEHAGSSTETPEVDDLLPSSAEVLGELEELREHRGISPSKIRDVAPFIQRLPITEDQRLFKRLSPDDRHMAAYAAIGCVLDHAIPDVISQQILILTLRYDYNLLTVQPREGWENAWRGPSLTARHNLVMALLQYGRSRYYELVRLAYDELANQLLLRDVSPCRGAAAQHLGQAFFDAGLSQILGMFSAAGQNRIREMLAEQAMTHVGSRWTPSGSTATERLLSVVRQALTSGYPEAVREARRTQSGPPATLRRGRLRGSFLRQDELEHLIAGDPSVPFFDRLEKLERLIVKEAVWRKDENGQDYVDQEPVYLSSPIARSYSLLASVLAESESETTPAGTAGERAIEAEASGDDDRDTPGWLEREA